MISRIVSWFEGLPSELRYSYYVMASFILTYLAQDLRIFAEQVGNRYVEAIVNFVIINTITYALTRITIKLQSNKK